MATKSDEKKDSVSEPLLKNDEVQNASVFERDEFMTMFMIGWPMLVSFFCRMGMASEDSAFVGHITTGQHSPADYLAAAGLADMVTNILVIPPLAFNQSLNALVSQAIGSGNKKMAGYWLQLSVFCLTIGYIPCLVAFFYVEQMLLVLGFSSSISMLAGTYAKWNVFWPIPNGWYQCMRFYFQAQGISRPAMYNNIFFLVMNAVFNWIFVFGGPFRYWYGWEGLGFIGAAISLSCSRSSQPLFYWLYMFVYKRAHAETWPGFGLGFLQRDRVKAFMQQSLPQVGTLTLQAAIGQTTTLLIAQLGNRAIAASSAASALTQIFTGGLSASLNAVIGIRVGFHLGAGNGQSARRASWIIFKISALSVGIIAAVLLPFGVATMAVITVDPDVQVLAADILPPVLVNTFAGLIVNCITGGVFTSQGRTTLSTILSMGIELPLSIGSVAILVMVFHTGLVLVYWAQAAVTCFEAVICMVIFVRSDWDGYARDARERQEADTVEGALSPAAKIMSPFSPNAVDAAAIMGGSFASPHSQNALRDINIDSPGARFAGLGYASHDDGETVNINDV